VPQYVLNYFGKPVTPTAAFPQRTTARRPYLALNLINQASFFRCYALVDSGADDCIFPSSFAAQLGLNYLTGRHYPFGGAASGQQDAYFFDLEIDIIGISRYAVPIGFSPALEQWGHGLLGQCGFFDKFTVAFYQSENKFTLTMP
jgi:hypothetical protein